MNELGFSSLASIARALDSTPQAVSNWKARNQIPYHIESKLNILDYKSTKPEPVSSISGQTYQEFNEIKFSDILLVIAEQLKVILLTAFISVFLTFTYVQFVKEPLYESWATVLLPENNNPDFGGLAGLASQFGVEVPSIAQADLSSPILFPDLLRSRVFGEKILNKEFHTEKYGKKLPLFSCNHSNSSGDSKK